MNTFIYTRRIEYVGIMNAIYEYYLQVCIYNVDRYNIILKNKWIIRNKLLMLILIVKNL